MKRLAFAAMSAFYLAASAGAGLAAEEPVLSISPAEQKALDDTYFNCDHEGSFGCLQAACKTGGDPADIQYLYHDVWQNFPEFLTPALRACFVRAGGKFR